jgi:fructose-1,6-bisphosphatase I
MPFSAFLQHVDPDLAGLLSAVADASVKLSDAVRNAPLRNLTGAMDTTNVQGEIVQKLDDYSNQVLMDYCKASVACAGYLSEENEGVTTMNETGSLVIAVDPLDGSSNIDIAAPIGTIFAIWKRKSVAGPILESDFLQKGDECIAAGYVLYGSATMLMLSVGKGVQLFALNSATATYMSVNNNVQLPSMGKIYSMNQGNLSKFEQAAKRFVAHCTETDKDTSRPYSIRYIGSMVGDMYRTFLKGGVFLYPAYEGETKGKLRLLYECIPMSFLAEQAGGMGTNGKERILSLQPTGLHERCAIVIGSSALVDLYLSFSK